MRNSLLLAGAFLALANFLPPALPMARAASDPATPPPARTAVKHSTQILTTPPAVKFIPTLTPPAATAGLTPAETQFILLINAERTSRGENALTVDPLLVATARAHSREMSDLNYFDHHSPTPGITTPMDRFLRALGDTGQTTPPYLLVGENIYYCSVFNDRYNVEYGHQALMNSPGHRANILEPRFTKIGVGVYQDASGQFWVTEMFLRDTDPAPAD